MTNLLVSVQNFILAIDQKNKKSYFSCYSGLWHLCQQWIFRNLLMFHPIMMSRSSLSKLANTLKTKMLLSKLKVKFIVYTNRVKVLLSCFLFKQIFISLNNESANNYLEIYSLLVFKMIIISLLALTNFFFFFFILYLKFYRFLPKKSNFRFTFFKDQQATNFILNPIYELVMKVIRALV